MPQVNDTTTPGRQPQNLQQAGAALDAAERIAMACEAIGEAPHVDCDFIDPRNGHLEHDCFSCPACEVRERASAYRALVRAAVIERGHRDNRRVGNREKLEHALRAARSRYNADDINARLTEFGEVIPPCRTARERIDVAAEIEALQIDIDTLEDRTRHKQSWACRMYELGLAYC